MDWGVILGVLPSLVQLLDSRRASEQEHVEKALAELSSAYHATRAYFADIESGAKPSSKDQMSLAEKWDHASIYIRRYDAGLASRLSLKSRFWREGGAWDRRQITLANIGLEGVRRDARVMLLLKQRV